MYKRLTKNFNKNKFILLFLLPSLLGCLLFIFIPTFFSLFLSFSDWNLLNDISIVGFKNYIDLFSSSEFWLVFKNTIIYAVVVTLVGTIIPLLLASVINGKIRGKDFYKTTYFLPFVTPMIVIAMIWQWIFDPNIGLVNYLFKININWLYDVKTAMFSLIFVSVWKLIGYNMIIFLSGFSSIPSQVYEAADIDGSSRVKTFISITIPLLSPTIFFVFLITTISSFQVFDLIYLMTQGGPNNSTNVLVYWLYKNAFEFFNIGKASAVAYVLFIIIFVLTMIQWNLRKKWVNTEND